MKFLEFSDGSLTQQWPFRLALGIPVFCALILCFPLWFNPSITFNLTPEGYSNFLELFKFPIGVLSLSIPLVAIVAHIQRTIQTSSQIEATKKKNISDSFFSHHKFITEALGKLPSMKAKAGGENFEYKINDPYLVYNYLFEKSSYQAGIITDELTSKEMFIGSKIEEISKIIYGFNQSSFATLEEELFAIHNLNNHLNKICHHLAIVIPEQSNNKLIMFKSQDGIVSLVMPFNDEDELKKKIHSVLTLCQKSFSLINLTVDANPSTRIYAASNNGDTYHLKHLFNCSVNTKMQPQYAKANAHSDHLESQYLHYLTLLQL